MPLLGALIQALFVGIAGWFTKVFLSRLAMRVVGVTALIAALAALMVFYNNTVSPLVASAFSTQYGQFLGLAFPPVAGTCLTAYAGVWAACGLYTLNRRAIQTTASA